MSRRSLSVVLSWRGVYTSPEDINDIAGIYMVLAGKKGTNGKWAPSSYKLLDIGQSVGLGGRLANHDREECWELNKPRGTTLLFKIAEMPSSDYDETDRRIVECCLRANNQPIPCGSECNEGYRRDDLVDITNENLYSPLEQHYSCP